MDFFWHFHTYFVWVDFAPAISFPTVRCSINILSSVSISCVLLSSLLPSENLLFPVSWAPFLVLEPLFYLGA